MFSKKKTKKSEKNKKTIKSFFYNNTKKIETKI